MKTIETLLIIGLLAGIASAEQFNLSFVGHQGGAYPYYFLDCSSIPGGARNVSMWETFCLGDAPCNNYTNSFWFKVEGKEMLALEQSGSPDLHRLTVYTRASSEIGDGSPAAWQEHPMNEPYADYLSSTTISLSTTTQAGNIDVPAAGTVADDIIVNMVENVELTQEYFRMPTVSEILRMIGVIS